MNKECIECGESVIGRIDKKYCSELCRNTFNNKAYHTNDNYVKDVNSMLRRNRKILKELTPEETLESRISKMKLLKKGFNFHYYTNISRNQKGADYFFCYEYGYSPLEKDLYYIFKQKEND